MKDESNYPICSNCGTDKEVKDTSHGFLCYDCQKHRNLQAARDSGLGRYMF